MIQIVLSAFVATLAFGIVFNIRGKKLYYASFGASIASAVYFLCMQWGINAYMSLFFASVVSSLYAEIMARVLKTPVTVFVICAVICLVPGGLMYYTMEEIINGNFAKSFQNGFEAIASAGALALGIIVVSSLMRLLTRYQKIMRKEAKK